MNYEKQEIRLELTADQSLDESNAGRIMATTGARGSSSKHWSDGRCIRTTIKTRK